MPVDSSVHPTRIGLGGAPPKQPSHGGLEHWQGGVPQPLPLAGEQKNSRWKSSTVAVVLSMPVICFIWLYHPSLIPVGSYLPRWKAQMVTSLQTALAGSDKPAQRVFFDGLGIGAAVFVVVLVIVLGVVLAGGGAGVEGTSGAGVGDAVVGGAGVVGAGVGGAGVVGAPPLQVPQGGLEQWHGGLPQPFPLTGEQKKNR